MSTGQEVETTKLLQFSEAVSFRRTNTGLVMLFNQASGIMYELNETASEIAATIAATEAATLSAIVDTLSTKFAGKGRTMEEDVARLVSDFLELGVIQEGERQTRADDDPSNSSS